MVIRRTATRVLCGWFSAPSHSQHINPFRPYEVEDTPPPADVQVLTTLPNGSRGPSLYTNDTDEESTEDGSTTIENGKWKEGQSSLASGSGTSNGISMKNFGSAGGDVAYKPNRSHKAKHKSSSNGRRHTTGTSGADRKTSWKGKHPAHTSAGTSADHCPQAPHRKGANGTSGDHDSSTAVKSHKRSLDQLDDSTFASTSSAIMPRPHKKARSGSNNHSRSHKKKISTNGTSKQNFARSSSPMLTATSASLSPPPPSPSPQSSSAPVVRHGNGKKKWRKGWKGWAEVDEDAELDRSKLIQIDEPPPVFGRQTRSGRAFGDEGDGVWEDAIIHVGGRKSM
jgi:hypothetical protein